MGNSQSLHNRSEGEMRKRQLTCRQLDRDCSKLKCGYSLPCPHHTAIIEQSTGYVYIPFTAKAAFNNRKKLVKIAEVISE